MKRIVLSLCIFGLALVLSACGGGGGGGGGGVVPDPTVPPVVPPVTPGTPPARVTDLAILQGTGTGQGSEFGMLRLTFTAPAAGTGGAVASYQIRYSGTAITDATFAQATPLPAQIAIPAPASAGTQVAVTIDASLLSAVEPGDPLRFAMRAVDASGGTAAVSSGVLTLRPWKMTLRFTPDGGQPFPVELGQQESATDATDRFDQPAPPALLAFAANVALAGRPEALLRDIRGTFAANGQQTLYTVELSGGTAGGTVTLDFPSFSTASPATYQFHLKIGDAAEAPLSGAPATFPLDGTGRRTVILRVAN